MTSHNLKTNPMKTLLNCITSKSTSIMQAVSSVHIFTHNPPTKGRQKNNFCGMSNLLINCRECAKKDNITKTNYTQPCSSMSHTQYIDVYHCQNLLQEKEGREPAGHTLKS